MGYVRYNFYTPVPALPSVRDVLDGDGIASATLIEIKISAT